MTADREPVPAWVYMAEVPPPVDDEPWPHRCGACGASIGPRWDHDCRGRDERHWSATAAVLAFTLVAALVVVAYIAGRIDRA